MILNTTQEIARALLLDPDAAAARPGARAIAWAGLKAAKGQTHRLDRLEPAPRVIPEPSPPAPLRARILARAAEHGIGPGTGGDAA